MDYYIILLQNGISYLLLDHGSMEQHKYFLHTVSELVRYPPLARTIHLNTTVSGNTGAEDEIQVSGFPDLPYFM